MQIQLNVDNVKLNRKPATGEEYGKLSKRLRNTKKKRTLEPSELVEFVKQGRAFTPAALNGQQAGDWEQQQVICADIDNDTGKKDENGNKIPLDELLTPEKAREAMQAHNIAPFFMYHTFSSKPDSFPKFRIIIVLAEPITDGEKAGELNKRFTAIFNRAVKGCADGSNKDLNRIYLPGQPGGIMFQEESITSIETLEALPEVPEEPKPEPKPKKPAAMYSEYDEENDRLQSYINNYDMLGYVKTYCSGKLFHIGGGKYRLNPCPVCGHDDCFTIYPDAHIFKCFSNDHAQRAGGDGKTGGNIVVLRSEINGTTEGEELKIIKYDELKMERPQRKAKKEKRNNPKHQEAEELTKTTETTDQAEEEGEEMTEKTAQQMQEAQTLREDNNQEREGAAAEQKQEEPKKTAEELAADQKAEETGDAEGQEKSGDRPPKYTPPFTSLFAEEFLQYCEEDRHPISTGIKGLDIALKGGLTDELYLLGAETGQGKSALSLNIAENIARAGTDVLYFALEMSRRELIARGVSAISWKYKEQYKDAGAPISAGDILYYDYDYTLKDFYKIPAKRYERQAAQYFKDCGSHLAIIENSINGLTAANIADTVKQHIETTGRKPVVFVDYLQMIAGDKNDRTQADRKSKTDAAIRTLKQISIKYKLPVFGISSLNRIGYGKRVTSASFKESGDLEYTAGVLLGLNLDAQMVNYKDENTAEATIKRALNPGKDKPRKMTLEVMKFRNGERANDVRLDYYATYNCFMMRDGLEDVNREESEIPFTQNKQMTIEEYARNKRK